MEKKWFVSRQKYWPDGQLCVEIAAGGRDYSNPDMLVEKYPGEGQEYDDPEEAAEAAIEIHKQWSRDCPDEEIHIAHGFTGGDTMPFSSKEEEQESYENILHWAKETKEKLPKCDYCGAILPDEFLYDTEYLHPDDKFCSQYCVEKAIMLHP